MTAAARLRQRGARQGQRHLAVYKLGDKKNKKRPTEAQHGSIERFLAANNSASVGQGQMGKESEGPDGADPPHFHMQL